METLPAPVVGSMALSGLANIVLAVLLVYLLRRPKKPVKFDMSAQDLLHDLTRHGRAVVKVEVIDMANIMLRSPRG